MRKYLEKLKERGDLLEVRRSVDPRHELAAISAKIHKLYNKAVLFHNVAGTKLPVVTNLYGAIERLGEILGTGAEDTRRDWNRVMRAAADREMPAATSVVDQIEYVDLKLSELPLITYSELDAAPYFTSAMFLAKEPGTNIHNLSFHRAMYVSNDELRCRLEPGHHLTMYHERAETLDSDLEAAILIGPPPSTFLTAVAPLRYDEDELVIASKLCGEKLGMRRCKHVDLMVPAATEIVIEGRFLPNERRDEGPFGEFMGYYTSTTKNAVFEVLAVTARKDAIFHSILCGSSEEVLSLELSIAGRIRERLSSVLPGILEVVCQPSVLKIIVKIQQEYPGHARQVLTAALEADSHWAKMCVIVDEDIDIHDLSDVDWAILTRSNPDYDVQIVPGQPFDNANLTRSQWGRLGIDATAPFARRQEFKRNRRLGLAEIRVEDYLDCP